MRRWIPLWFATLVWGGICVSAVLRAGNSSAIPLTSAAVASEDPEGNDDTIASAQLRLAMRYQRFENTMLQVAEYLRKTDPERADLLVRAIGKSKETRLPDQFEHLINLLKQEQLGDAVQEQEQVVVLLEGLLSLLQSEDRKADLEKEQERLKDLIKDVDRLIDRQTDLRAQTERKDNPRGLEQSQKKLAGDAERLIDKIDEQDRARNNSSPEGARQAQPKGEPDQSGEKSGSSPSDEPTEKKAAKSSDDRPGSPSKEQGGETEKPSGEPGAPDSKESPKPEDSPTDPAGKKDEGQESPSNGSSQPMPGGESNPSGEQKSKSGKPSPGQPGQPMPPQQGSPGDPEKNEPTPGADSRDSASKPNKTPGRDEIERAKDEMERAIEELKKKNHGQASDEQDRAISELIKAKDRLEEILRQLREEEREMMLAALEARFRDMLARQLTVYNGTVGLRTISSEAQSDRQRNQSVALARAEEGIVLLANKALTLLKEEGSSIALPEAVEEMRDDMLTVVQRLERFDVGELTQSIERDIMEALEELVQALQNEMEKSKNKDQKQPPPNGEPPDPALVDQLAELKTLRALQFRVNRRTKILGREVEGEQARDPDLLKQLHQLAKRQEKIQRATYDLSSGRNR
ncbi:MAG: hypothetical protein U0872_11985 [Planctomycetaceae bacterium]